MKDPAFLFYSSDFLIGTALLSDAEVGQYIKSCSKNLSVMNTVAIIMRDY
jgi:hypothetical protein